MQDMEPASTIIKKMGGANAVAEIVGVHKTRVYKWQKPKSEGGTGGTIPLRHAPFLLSAARELSIELDRADFVPVAPGDTP